MQKWKILPAMLAAAMFACAPCAAQEAAGEAAVVEEKIEFVEDAALAKLLIAARAENPQIAAAKQRTEAAKASLDAAAAQMGPDLFGGLGAMWQKDGVVMDTGIPGIGSINAVGSHTYAAAIGLSQVIYAGGSLTAQKEAERLALGATEAQELRIEQSVENSTRRAYYSFRDAQAQRRVAEEALRLAEEHLGRAEKLFAAGVVAKSDVLRAKVSVSESELTLIRAKSAEANAMTALRRAVGADPAEVELAEPDAFAKQLLDDPAGVKELEPFVSRMPEGDNVEAAFGARAELKAYALLSKQAEKLARAEQGKLLPQILGTVAYVTAEDNFFPTDNGEPVAAIGLYWNLYDSGEARAKTREARAKAKELLFQLDDMKNSIRMEVVQAEQNMASALSRFEVASRQTEQAREDYRIAVRRYEENVGTSLEESDSRLALVNALTETATALYDIKTAEADLIYAIGK